MTGSVDTYAELIFQEHMHEFSAPHTMLPYKLHSTPHTGTAASRVACEGVSTVLSRSRCTAGRP